MAGLVQVRLQPRQLFRDVDADAVDGGFLADALGNLVAAHRRHAGGRGQVERFLQALGQLLLVVRDQLRDRRRQALDDRQHGIDALHQRRLERLALAAARFQQLVQRLARGAGHGFAQRVLRQFRLDQHARPAQDLAHAQRAGAGEGAGHGGLQRADLRQQAIVERQRGAARIGALQVDAALQLAARQLGHQHLAQRRLKGAALFRGPEQQVEETRIDSAEFHRNGGGAPARLALCVGQWRLARRQAIPCHAVDHWMFS
ncbi:hypothetical protein D3C81_1047410 [compost metagenome]